MYYHEIMETEILPQYLSLKVGAYVTMNHFTLTLFNCQVHKVRERF